MRLGAHVGTAGGLRAAAAYAEAIGCECVQVFAKTPLRWEAPRHDPEDEAAFREALASAGIGPVFTHTAYLLNLSGADEALGSRSAAALADEMERAARLGARGVITHVGTGADDPGVAVHRLAASLRSAFAAAEAGIPVLLENSAGAGSLFLSREEHFAAVFDSLGEDATRVGVCLDTCHAHAAGLDVRSPAGWRDVLDAFEAAVGADAISVVHANDCAAPFGAARDRHAWIGEGTIGEDGFAAMLAQPRLAAVCAITEMPGDAPEKDVVNLRRLRALRASCEGP